MNENPFNSIEGMLQGKAEIHRILFNGVIYLVLWGSVVNALAIMSGALLGSAVRFPGRVQQTIMNALGLAVMIIGISMGMESDNILIPIMALVIGSIIGETLDIEGRIAKLGRTLQLRTAGRKGKWMQLTLPRDF